jgi:hypothetical protein
MAHYGAPLQIQSHVTGWPNPRCATGSYEFNAIIPAHVSAKHQDG